jgi:hypothetical protein
MITLTMRRIKDDPVLTSSRLSSRAGVTLGLVRAAYSGSHIYAIGADSSQRKSLAMPRKGPLRRILAQPNEKPRRVETGGEAGRGGLKQNCARSSETDACYVLRL